MRKKVLKTPEPITPAEERRRDQGYEDDIRAHHAALAANDALTMSAECARELGWYENPDLLGAHAKIMAAYLVRDMR